MSPRLIRLLHVEDDAMQQRILAHHLSAIDEVQFTIACAESEDAAVEEFRHGKTEFVILDYQLAQGDGLGCLRRLRQLDRVVPIIALSGVATPEVAAELVQAGADDYISKQELDAAVLGRSVSQALLRAEACRRQGVSRASEPGPEVRQLLRELCETFAAAVGPEFTRRLDALEQAVRGEGVQAQQMVPVFEAICRELGRGPLEAESNVQRLLRPVLLEVLLRLSREPQPGGGEAPLESVPER